MATNFTEELGKVQERYRFLAKLGSGGMADVFLGVQHGAENFQRLVVIKRIHSMWLKKDNALKMFIDEARTVASLNHPHIVKIFDLSRMGQDICIAMEYVDGENLEYIKRSLKEGDATFPLSVLCKLMVEACEALHYAHSAKTTEGKALNLIHRDIGPHNLMVDSNGYLKVIDFGIAKSTAQTELTSPGMIKGKFSYLAPDLFKYVDVDGRSDLYALGLVFYEMLTLRRPFAFRKDVAVAEVLQRITTEKLPPVSSVVETLPAELDGIVAKAIHKEREQRYQTGADLAADIRALAIRHGGLASTTDVEKWFNKIFDERITRRREFERRAMAKASQQVKQKLEESDAPLMTNETVNISGIVQRQAQESTGSQVLIGPQAAPTRRVNPYVFTVLLFALIAGAAVLAHQLFWKPKRESVLDKNINVDGRSANLFIDSTPPGADVFVNNLLVGNSGRDGVELRVDPGRDHLVMLRLAGHQEYSIEVHGEPYGQRKIRAKLIALKEPEPEEKVQPAGEDLDRVAKAIRRRRGSRRRGKKNHSRSFFSNFQAGRGSDRGGSPENPLTDDAELPDEQSAEAFDENEQSSPSEGEQESAADEGIEQPFDPLSAVYQAETGSASTKSAPDNGAEAPDETAEGVDTSSAPEKPETQAEAASTKAFEEAPTQPKETVEPPKIAKLIPLKGPIEINSSTLNKRRIAGKDPAYPKIAMRRRRETTILVKVTVNKRGEVSDYKFIGGDPTFHRSVSRAIRSWRFEPYAVNGRPVDTTTVLKYVFKLSTK